MHSVQTHFSWPHCCSATTPSTVDASLSCRGVLKNDMAIPPLLRAAFVADAALSWETKVENQMDRSSTKLRVLLADDSDQTIQSVSEILATEFEVVGRAVDGADAITAVIRLKPDLIVMDIVMPNKDGIQAARRLSQMNSPTKIVFLTGLEDQDYVDACLAAGASGYVFKCRAAFDLPRALHEAVAGRVFVSPRPRD
jgi:CheY-like chemotaxis protein